MTMVPAQTLSIHHQLYCFGGYGGSYPEEEEKEEEEEGFYETAAVLLGGGSGIVLVSDAHIPMAEDESKTPTTTTNTIRVCLNNNSSEDDREEAAASSCKDVGDEDDAGWLQLSIGGSAKINTPPLPPPAAAAGEGVGLLKLDLSAPSRSEGKTVISQEKKPIFHVPQQVPSFLFQAGVAGSASSTVAPPHHHHKKINWEFRPTVFSVGADSLSSLTSSSSNDPPSTFMQLGSYFARTTPFQLHGDGGVDFRVIDPPRRPNSGIWFSLQASQKQAKEPVLPQIPKSYLRIRDGRITVRLLKKYLVNKLRLDSESEVEITCRGQQLQPFLTLEHVRDNIWNPRDGITLLPDSSPTTDDHLMLLQYSRTA